MKRIAWLLLVAGMVCCSPFVCFAYPVTFDYSGTVHVGLSNGLTQFSTGDTFTAFSTSDMIFGK